MAKVEIGDAVRLGEFGYMKQDDAVEGVILMRVGEQAQVVLKRVEALTKELNERVLPPDVKIVPYYDRSGLIDETTSTVEENLVRGMVLVLIPTFWEYFCSTFAPRSSSPSRFPFALMFSFICLDWRAHSGESVVHPAQIDFGMPRGTEPW